MNDYRNIITIESGKRSGQPCIRGMRITVYARETTILSFQRIQTSGIEVLFTVILQK